MNVHEQYTLWCTYYSSSTRRQADGTVEGTHEGSTVPDTGYTFIRKNVYTTLL